MCSQVSQKGESVRLEPPKFEFICGDKWWSVEGILN